MDNTLNYKWATVALLFVMLVTVFSLYKDFGISWDEYVQQQYGQYIVDYYLSRFTDQSATNYKNLYLYGGVFDTVVATIINITHWDTYHTRHLLNALVGFIGIVGCLKLANFLAGPRAAFIACLLLFLEPFYFGNMFINPKDIPFAAGYVWSLYYMLSACRYFPAIPPRLLVKLGIAIGLTLAVRAGGFLLFFYMVLLVTVYAFWPAYIVADSDRETRPNYWQWQSIRSVLVVFGIAYFVMLIFWPWAQQAPLTRPLQALSSLSKFEWQGDVLFRGNFISAKTLPSTYLLQHLLLKLPEVIIVSIIVGLTMVLWSIRKKRFNPSKLHLGYAFFITFTIVFPVLYATIKGAVLYDSIRHFLFIIPLLCVVSAVIISALITFPGKSGKRLAYAFYLPIFLLASPQLYAIVQLHPYQYVYYNSFAGGVKGAAGRYELDYWAISYKEAVTKLAHYLSHKDGLNFSKNIYNIYVCPPEFPAKYYFPDNFRLVKAPNRADFEISFTRWDCHKKNNGKTITNVTTSNVTLTTIKRLANTAP